MISGKSKAKFANAIVWAAVVLASALLAADTGPSPLLLFIYVAGWLVTDQLVSVPDDCHGASCNLLRRWIGRTTD